MPPAQEFKLWLMVYFGDPDKHWTRHIALFFQAPEGKPHITYHVKKVNQAWKLEMLDEYDVMKSINIVGKVSLGNISITPMQLKQIMESVKIVNNVGDNLEDDDSSCQNWTGRALQALEAAGYITAVEVTRGIDGMVDIVHEAAA
ncbi:hypothetical protein A9K55_007407 [Cordyceps militaris]|uniref:Uncharacterized protein n=1 Tax=Cordyceps militaris TaxID=73501 RepID=A0A2H4SG33_CORMI|nr:hypothetical protein A9K55_007407 [Cordyceps militaris]